MTWPEATQRSGLPGVLWADTRAIPTGPTWARQSGFFRSTFKGNMHHWAGYGLVLGRCLSPKNPHLWPHVSEPLPCARSMVTLNFAKCACALCILSSSLQQPGLFRSACGAIARPQFFRSLQDGGRKRPANHSEAGSGHGQQVVPIQICWLKGPRSPQQPNRAPRFLLWEDNLASWPGSRFPSSSAVTGNILQRVS